MDLDEIRKAMAEFDDGLEMIAHLQDNASVKNVELLAMIMRKLLESANRRIEAQRMEIAILRDKIAKLTVRVDKARDYVRSEPWKTATQNPSSNGYAAHTTDPCE